MEKNLLNVETRQAFRRWLEEYSATETECWLPVRYGKPTEEGLYYLDAVEEALCFGWIDSVKKPIDGKVYQRFSPRRENGNWTELNKERVRRLEALGLMTERGRRVLPPMEEDFVVDEEIVCVLKKHRLWTKFRAFPPLYQRVRASNIAFYKKRFPEKYPAMLARLVEETKKGKMHGEWDDYGRLTAYKKNEEKKKEEQ